MKPFPLFSRFRALFLFGISFSLLQCTSRNKDSVEILNVSYDPTREFYKAYNVAFSKYWNETQGQKITVAESHGGSGKQARSVIEGLEADVVTLALAYDIDNIALRGKLLPENWQSLLPHNSTPYTSTIVFLVRKGNPKKIRDWNDLIRPGISIITPNPKTSGGARWNYLAAWAYGLSQFAGDSAKTYSFVAEMYRHVPVLDGGARGSTTTFVQRGIGDVLLTWENEAMLAVKEMSDAKVEIITPSISILSEPPVAVIAKYAAKHGTTKIAQAYLEYLFSETAQEIAAKHFYRPRSQRMANQYASQFPPIKLLSIDSVFGGWSVAQKIHFNDHGLFDEMLKANK